VSHPLLTVKSYIIRGFLATEITYHHSNTPRNNSVSTSQNENGWHYNRCTKSWLLQYTPLCGAKAFEHYGVWRIYIRVMIKVQSFLALKHHAIKRMREWMWNTMHS